MEKTIKYKTRDADGKDVVTDVKIKQFPAVEAEFDCPFCARRMRNGNRIRDVVSGNFTDWADVSDFVCEDCADLFSLYFYSYIKDPDGIRLLNVRELRDALTTPQKPPFLFCITTSRKKHLFFRAVRNDASSPFAVNLETETIYTTPERMKTLFDFVESLQTLGVSKERIGRGDIFIPDATFPSAVWDWLRKELKQSREIQIPLYCGQKREIGREEAICFINSAPTA